MGWGAFHVEKERGGGATNTDTQKNDENLSDNYF